MFYNIKSDHFCGFEPGIAPGSFLLAPLELLFLSKWFQTPN